MVDRSDLYPGAVVTVRARVSRVDDATACVWIKRRDGATVVMEVDIPDILSVEPRPLAVGDRVRTPGGNDGAIEFIRDDEAVLVWRTGSRAGKLSGPQFLHNLTRLPEPAPAEKAMRFKVGDEVVVGALGTGRIVEVDPSRASPYSVHFQGFGRSCFPEADLSPAPAEERAP